MINAEQVESIFMDCLFCDWEDTSSNLKAEGITINVGFHPERLEGHRAEIEAMLGELPDAFQSGAGMSFLNACMDKDGVQWTSFHQRMEQLFLLGLALNKVKCMLPRNLWSSLPGGMPYYVIL